MTWLSTCTMLILQANYLAGEMMDPARDVPRAVNTALPLVMSTFPCMQDVTSSISHREHRIYRSVTAGSLVEH